MIEAVGLIQPSPSDFAGFVYCGLKWALDKNKELDNIKKLKAKCYDKSTKKETLYIGQQNEDKCIEWVLNNFKVSRSQIIFDGTGDNNQNYLVTVIDSLGVSMKCKPDLIISGNNQNLLFEFKALSDIRYLDKLEFRANHAQIWCYRYIKNIQVDKCYLLRYCRDPFYKTVFSYEKPYRLKEILYTEREIDEYIGLFEQYVNAVKLREKKDKRIQQLIIDNSPKTDSEKQQKCYSCIYRNLNECPQFLY